MFTIDDFILDVEQSPLAQLPHSDVAELFAMYDATLRSILDKHAPYKAVRLRALMSAARWYNSDCRVMKANTRCLKEIYRHTHTPASLSTWWQQFALQRKVFMQRFTSFWTETISENRHDS